MLFAQMMALFTPTETRNIISTSMHSSRVHTDRLLTVYGWVGVALMQTRGRQTGKHAGKMQTPQL